jgi:acetyl-CoA carboxylase biotin carboxyl carrier protein
MKLSEIQDLIKFVAKSGVSEVELEIKDFKIVIKTPYGKNETHQQPVIVQTIPAAAAVPQQTPATAKENKAAAEKQNKATEDSKLITIKSPMIGTFYRSPGPDKAVFVNVGDELKPGKVICIIEAMKLFNEIESDITGKIVKMLVDDATPVEYDQPLFLVEPA